MAENSSLRELTAEEATREGTGEQAIDATGGGQGAGAENEPATSTGSDPETTGGQIAEELSDEETSALDELSPEELQKLGDDALEFVCKTLSLTATLYPQTYLLKDDSSLFPAILGEIYDSEWLEYVAGIVAKSGEPDAGLVALGLEEVHCSASSRKKCIALRLGVVNEILLLLAKWRDLKTVLNDLALAQCGLHGAIAALDELSTRLPHYERYVLNADLNGISTQTEGTPSDSSEENLFEWISSGRADINAALSGASGYAHSVESAIHDILSACCAMFGLWLPPYPGRVLRDAAFYRFLEGEDQSGECVQEICDLIDLRQTLTSRTDVEYWEPSLSAVDNYIAQHNVEILCGSMLGDLLSNCEEQIDKCEALKESVGNIAKMFSKTLDMLHNNIVASTIS